MGNIDDKSMIDAITSNEIIKHKLEGIVNKVDIAAATAPDRHLSVVLQEVLELHVTLGERLRAVSES